MQRSPSTVRDCIFSVPPSTCGGSRRTHSAAVLLCGLGTRQVSLLARVLAVGGSREAAPREVSAGEGASLHAADSSSRTKRSFLHVGATNMSRLIVQKHRQKISPRVGKSRRPPTPNVISVVIASHCILHQFLQEINKLKCCSYLPRLDFCSSAPD